MKYTQRPIVIQSNGLGTAGFVVSLIGIFFTCGLLSPIGLFFSLIALMKRPRGMAFAGFILGAIGSWWLFVFGLGLLGMLTGLSLPVSEPTRTTPPKVMSSESTIPMSESEPKQVPETPMRTWSSANGEYSVEARFMWSNGTTVRLKKQDDSEIDVPLDKLSDNDREWIISRKHR